jgi:hypothetical protein
MTAESRLYMFLKNTFAEAFEELGYQVEKGVKCPPSECSNRRRAADVCARKADGSIIDIRVGNTPIPFWAVVRVGTNIRLTPQQQIQLIESIIDPQLLKKMRSKNTTTPENLLKMLRDHLALDDEISVTDLVILALEDYLVEKERFGSIR